MTSGWAARLAGAVSSNSSLTASLFGLAPRRHYPRVLLDSAPVGAGQSAIEGGSIRACSSLHLLVDGYNQPVGSPISC